MPFIRRLVGIASFVEQEALPLRHHLEPYALYSAKWLSTAHSRDRRIEKGGRALCARTNGYGETENGGEEACSSDWHESRRALVGSCTLPFSPHPGNDQAASGGVTAADG